MLLTLLMLTCHVHLKLLNLCPALSLDPLLKTSDDDVVDSPGVLVLFNGLDFLSPESRLSLDAGIKR